jgi:hypothetical protein
MPGSSASLTFAVARCCPYFHDEMQLEMKLERNCLSCGAGQDSPETCHWCEVENVRHLLKEGSDPNVRNKVNVVILLSGLSRTMNVQSTSMVNV